jgi:hypothetical protein
MASEYEIERRLAALETRTRGAIDGSYLARYVMPPLALIALIAVYALYVAFQVPDMTRAEAARTVPATVAQAVQARVPEVVGRAVPPAVVQQVERAVPEVVGRELPALVDRAVQDSVARAVPDAVTAAARTLPATIATEVARAAPEAAQRLLPAMVERAVPEAVARAVPPAAAEAVTRAVPDAVRAALAQALPPAVEQSVAAALSPQARETLDRMRLVQMGSHQCSQQRRRAAESWTVIYRATVTFTREFREPPAVFLSLGQMEAYFAQPALTYSVLAENVTRQGFDLVVRGAFLESLTACQVQWIALDRGFQVGEPAAAPAPLRPPAATGG